MTPLVFIDGDQGTTGLQVRQWLAGRTDLRLLQLPPEHRKSAAHRAEALNDCDVALLCLPDDAAREAVALVRRPGVRVIDASSAHRTAPGWVYGLPELEAAQPAEVKMAKMQVMHKVNRLTAAIVEFISFLHERRYSIACEFQDEAQNLVYRCQHCAHSHQYA